MGDRGERPVRVRLQIEPGNTWVCPARPWRRRVDVLAVLRLLLRATLSGAAPADAYRNGSQPARLRSAPLVIGSPPARSWRRCYNVRMMLDVRRLPTRAWPTDITRRSGDREGDPVLYLHRGQQPGQIIASVLHADRPAGCRPRKPGDTRSDAHSRVMSVVRPAEPAGWCPASANFGSKQILLEGAGPASAPAWPGYHRRRAFRRGGRASSASADVSGVSLRPAFERHRAWV